MTGKQGFGERLRQLRKQAGLTQESLAEILNLSYMTIRRWEAEKIIPRVDEVRRIAEVLGCTESELLNGPSTDSWELKLVVSKTNEGGTVDMTSSKSSAVLNVADDVMAVTLSAPYELWEDDAKFEELIADLRRKRALGLKSRKEDW